MNPRLLLHALTIGGLRVLTAVICFFLERPRPRPVELPGRSEEDDPIGAFFLPLGRPRGRLLKGFPFRR